MLSQLTKDRGFSFVSFFDKNILVENNLKNKIQEELDSIACYVKISTIKISSFCIPLQDKKIYSFCFENDDLSGVILSICVEHKDRLKQIEGFKFNRHKSSKNYSSFNNKSILTILEEAKSDIFKL